MLQQRTGSELDGTSEHEKRLGLGNAALHFFDIAKVRVLSGRLCFAVMFPRQGS